MALVRDPQTQGILKPALGLFTATTLIVGSMIGSGIFRLPAAMMGHLLDPGMLLLVWIVGGVFTICGALTFAEMAGMFPQAGGQYVFLRESLGKKWAFLYGWTFFWVVQTGIIAAVAIVFAEFTRRLFGFEGLWVPTIAVLCIVSLSVVNYLGAKFGGLVQNIFTIAKVGALALLVLLGFLLGDPTHNTFTQTVVDAPGGIALFSAFFTAMLIGLFAMDGWPQAAYVAPEIKNPTRSVPRAMILGVTSVIALYILATFVFVYLLPVSQIVAIDASSGQQVIAAEAAKAFSGETGAKLISAAVMISTFGTVNAFILTSPRIYYAVAQDHMFPARLRKIDPKYNTPTFAILVQGVWAGLLVCLGRFAPDAYIALVAAVTFCIWLFYIPTTIGYFRLRFTQPDRPRPYRTTLYPVVPIVFLLAGLLVVGNALVSDLFKLFTDDDLTGSEVANLTSLWGTLFVLLGIPILWFWRSRARKGLEDPSAEAKPESPTPPRPRGKPVVVPEA